MKRSFLLCVIGFALTLFCALFFGVEFYRHYKWEKELSSIENRLHEFSSIFKEKGLAEQIAKKANPSFLENTFSHLNLLNLERGHLELQEKRKGLSEEEKRRLHFLTEENFLSFRSHKKTSSEVEEKLARTVQIDENDLPEILKRIENPESSIRIKRLYLERRPSSSNYNLYLELWRKES